MRLDRRAFLAGLLLAGRARAAPRDRLPAPDLSGPTRVLVGLRPFRPTGFVVRSEPVGAVRLVHHYGHGGAGLTLSWGTAAAVVEHLQDLPSRRVAVVGAGAVGLATACLLQERGFEVTIHAEALPPHTTSDVAGGWWGPVGVLDPARATPERLAQLGEAATLAHRRFEAMKGAEYGVRGVDAYTLGAPGAPLPGVGRPSYRWPDGGPFTGAVGVSRGLLIDPTVYLPALLAQIRAAGGRIVRGRVTRASLGRLDAAAVINCAGLGARALVEDPELTADQGQLVALPAQPAIDYALRADTRYLLPRRDAILLGGSHRLGEESLEPDPVLAAQILDDHRRIFATLRV